MNLRLGGKTALVSGSYRGTGLIIAKRLAEEGARVLVHGLEAGQAEAAVPRLVPANRLASMTSPRLATVIDLKSSSS